MIKMQKAVQGTNKPHVEHTEIDRMFKFIQKMKALGKSYEDLTHVDERRYIYMKYGESLAEQGGIDFNDMILLCINLLETNEDIRKDYTKCFEYVLVDEYQDLNPTQFKILELISKENKRVTIVGDDDQSIYGFRGGSAKLFKNFKTLFPSHDEKQLKVNYRSTQTIINASQAVIQHNKERISKEIIAELGKGEKIRVHVFDSAAEEHKFVVNKIKQLVSQGYQYRDISILCRVRKNVLKPFEVTLKENNIPFTSTKNRNFADRLVIKDLCGYLSLIVHGDSESFVQV